MQESRADDIIALPMDAFPGMTNHRLPAENRRQGLQVMLVAGVGCQAYRRVLPQGLPQCGIAIHHDAVVPARPDA